MSYLFPFAGHGVFSPDGKVALDPSEVEKANKEVSYARVARILAYKRGNS